MLGANVAKPRGSDSRRATGSVRSSADLDVPTCGTSWDKDQSITEPSWARVSSVPSAIITGTGSSYGALHCP
jgi:hypothetical protein